MIKSAEQCTGTSAAVEGILGRQLSSKERNLIIFEPRCGVCFRTERDLRAVTEREALRQRLDHTRKLKRCQDCAHVFCCSNAHGLMILPGHEDKSKPDSKCSTLRTMMTDDRVAVKFSFDEDGPVAWVPARRKLRITRCSAIRLLRATRPGKGGSRTPPPCSLSMCSNWSSRRCAC